MHDSTQKPTAISYEELQRLLMDIDVADSEIARYLNVDMSVGGPFGASFEVNRDLVDMTERQVEFESAMKVGNLICKARRVMRAKKNLRKGDPRALIVSEGDSWFQFPFLLDDVIDELGRTYITWGVGEAGDTAQRMLRKRDYAKPLSKHRDRVKAFLFSGAGNDVIGEDSSGAPSLLGLIMDGVQSDKPADYIDTVAVGKKFFELQGYYEGVIADVRRLHSDLPILLHGYDYVFPGSPDDPRNPKWAKPDEWLGSVMKEKKVSDPTLQRDIIKLLIDRVYGMIGSIASTDARIHVIDVRGTLPRIDDWADEIHPTNEGFKKISAHFESVLSQYTGAL